MGVTIKQIAEEAGLSWPAVSQILKSGGRFAPATRQRVLDVASRRGYRPNASARALRHNRTKLVGVIFRNASDHPFTNLAAFEYLLGVNQRFQTAEYDTVLVRAGDLLGGEAAEPRVFRERLVDGIIAVGSIPDAVIRRLKQLSSAVIWVDGPVWEPACCLRRDEEAAGRMAVNALVRIGYRSVRFVGRAAAFTGHHSHTEREAGARAAAAEAGVGYDVVQWPEGDRELELDAIRAWTRREAGLVVGSLPVARWLVHQAASLGRVPGRDFGIVCCDDSMDTGLHWPNLCRVRFDRYALGNTAAGMMLKLLAHPSDPPPSLRVGSHWTIGNTAWGAENVDADRFGVAAGA